MTDQVMRIYIDDREYPLAAPFTNRELHLVKTIAGVRAGELHDAIVAGDNDVLVALAHIGLRRVGAMMPTVEQLWNMPATALRLELPELSEEELEEPDPTIAADGGEKQPGNPETSPNGPGSPNTVTSSI